MSRQTDLQTHLDNASHCAPIIGYHRAALSQKFGAPRQPNLVKLISAIEMLAPFDTPLAFTGLEAFSHLWLTWQFHHNKPSNKDRKDNACFRAQVRPPRLGGNQKIGVFASRSMYRPSQLGLSVVKLERIQVVKGRVILIISGADMIDGTPIIDIKPYVAYSDSIAYAHSGFAPIAPVCLQVTIRAEAQAQFQQLIAKDTDDNTNKINGDSNIDSAAVIDQLQQQLMKEDYALIQALIAQDPRPAYRRKELHTIFTMRYKSVDVSFCQIEPEILQIVAIHDV